MPAGGLPLQLPAVLRVFAVWVLLDEGLEPHKVQAVFIHGSDAPDTFIDISEVLGVKLAALKEHRTQMGTWDPTEMITGWARMHGRRRRLAAAEAFRLGLTSRRITTEEYFADFLAS